MASKRKGTITLNYNQNSDEDFALYATSKKGAELLGAIYDLWERGKLDMGSFGPVNTKLAEMLCVNNKDQFKAVRSRVRTAREKGEARR